jgi:hypothetical protein
VTRALEKLERDEIKIVLQLCTSAYSIASMITVTLEPGNMTWNVPGNMTHNKEF